MYDVKNYSVLMSVYYKEQPGYLKQAVESMLSQTIPTDDLVIVCDGPLTPKLDEVIQNFENAYPGIIQVVHLKKNCGLGNALNEGLKYCKNELVARMDSDDLSVPERCELQLHMFQENPELAFCSGKIAEFADKISEITGYRIVPGTHEEICRYAKRRNPMNHMAVMFRKSKVEEAGGYIEVKLAEDYYLWVRMLMKGFQAANTEELLIYARTGNGMYQRRGGWSYVKSICSLQTSFFKSGFINCFEWVENCVVRSAVYLLPAKLREKVYLNRLRKREKTVEKKSAIISYRS